jgi:hypothetical protein
MFKEISRTLKETRVLFDKELNKTNKDGFKFEK